MQECVGLYADILSEFDTAAAWTLVLGAAAACVMGMRSLASRYTVSAALGVVRRMKYPTEGVLALLLSMGAMNMQSARFLFCSAPLRARAFDLQTGTALLAITVVFGGVVLFRNRKERVNNEAFHHTLFYATISVVFLIWAIKKDNLRVCGVFMLITYLLHLSFVLDAGASERLSAHIDPPHSSLDAYSRSGGFPFVRAWWRVADMLMLVENQGHSLPDVCLFLSPVCVSLLYYLSFFAVTRSGVSRVLMSVGISSGILYLKRKKESQVRRIYVFFASVLMLHALAQHAVSAVTAVIGVRGISEDASLFFVYAVRNVLPLFFICVVGARKGMYRTCVLASIFSSLYCILLSGCVVLIWDTPEHPVRISPSNTYMLISFTISVSLILINFVLRHGMFEVEMALLNASLYGLFVLCFLYKPAVHM